MPGMLPGMAKRNQVLDFIITAAAAADVEQIPAPGVGLAIRVLGYSMISAGATNATWKSGATAKSGAMPLAANTGLSPSVGSPDGGARQFQCAENQALNLGLSAAIQVSGHGTYQIVKSSGYGSE